MLFLERKCLEARSRDVRVIRYKVVGDSVEFVNVTMVIAAGLQAPELAESARGKTFVETLVTKYPITQSLDDI